MKLFEFFNTHYIIAKKKSGEWSVAKFAGNKQPDNVYTVIEKKPGVFWTDSPGFAKVGQAVKTINLVKKFIADGEPKFTYYHVDDKTDKISGHPMRVDESDTRRLPNVLRRAMGYDVENSWPLWVQAMIERGADPKYLKGDAEKVGIGAYGVDSPVVFGFWYGNYGVILRKAAIATDPLAGDFEGLPPGFDPSGELRETFDPYVAKMPAHQFVEWLANIFKQHPFVQYKMGIDQMPDGKKLTPEKAAANLYDEQVQYAEQEFGGLGRRAIEAAARDQLIDVLADIMSNRPYQRWAPYTDPALARVMGVKEHVKIKKYIKAVQPKSWATWYKEVK